jgi:glycosyltransferase involved in cell wall biosynthesis
MKIAIITPVFPPYAGGIGAVAFEHAKYMKQKGEELTVFTPLYPNHNKDHIDPVAVKRLKPLFSYGNAAYVPALYRFIKEFNVVHLHYPFFGGAEVIWRHRRKLKRRGIKVVVHYHMDVVGTGIMKTFFSIHKKIFLPKLIKMADRVIVTSNDYAKNSDIAKLFDKYQQKFREVPNGVNTKIFIPAEKSEKILSKHNIQPSQKIVLFVGGLDKAHYFKGVDVLIEAMSRLKQSSYDWRLVIVGSGDLQKEYESLASQLHIDAKTVFAGYVTEQDLPLYYQSADCVVLPSIDKSEAFGMVLVEAMACGKPVVASNLAGVRSVFTENKEGLLSKIKDADDLATKINYILNNEELVKDFGIKSRQKAVTTYDWNVLGEKILKIYEEIK